MQQRGIVEKKGGITKDHNATTWNCGETQYINAKLWKTTNGNKYFFTATDNHQTAKDKQPTATNNHQTAKDNHQAATNGRQTAVNNFRNIPPP